MEPLAMILTALAVAASLIAKETASEAIKDAYRTLKTRLQAKLAGSADSELILAKYEEKPETWREPLRDALAEARVVDDDDIVRAAFKIVEEAKADPQTGDQYDVQVEGNVGAVVQGPNANVTVEGPGKAAFDRMRSDSYKELGKLKVQQWGEKMHHGEWDWHLLGHAIGHYVDSIKYDPSHQHPWTNLAYVYHLIGDSRKAEECLQRSLRLAAPGPDHPGDNYRRVRLAVDNDAPLSGRRLARPPMPDWFRERYRRHLS